jgi:SAM-dependent methyltransferase
MPTSEAWQIPWVCDVIARQRPRSVLDVGAGYGKYGLLAREYSPAVERVDAIDVSRPRYEGYDHVYVGDVTRLDDVLPADAPRYDLALFLDVIEHFEKPRGWAALEAITRRARRVLVTTPWGFRRQEIPGMPYETHRSGWLPWEFGARITVHEWRVFPGHFTRRLKLPRLWQVLVLVSARGDREPPRARRS